MKVLLSVGGVLAGAMCLPAVALVAVIAVGGTALACTPPAVIDSDAALVASAPVPEQARAWIALTHTACPDLPTPWIAAVMAH